MIIRTDNLESGNLESGNLESDNLESDNLESGNLESGNLESGNLESGNLESGNLESGNLESDNQEYQAKYVVNCASCYADRIARLVDKKIHYRIIPFRAEYYDIKPQKNLLQGIVYSVPNPKYPFLGVHFTKKIGGNVEIGHTTALAFSREGYKRTDISLRDIWDQVFYKGFWIVVKKQWREWISELYRSYYKKAFIRSLKKYFPDFKEETLQNRTAGIKAQLINEKGELIGDLCTHITGRCLHVLNVPSPGATASLVIGSQIAELLPSKDD